MAAGPLTLPLTVSWYARFVIDKGYVGSWQNNCPFFFGLVDYNECQSNQDTSVDKASLSRMRVLGSFYALSHIATEG
jgi:hypothetical protein